MSQLIGDAQDGDNHGLISGVNALAKDLTPFILQGKNYCNLAANS
jgi:hypothetical protein